MASEESRRAAGADGTGVPSEKVEPRKRGAKGARVGKTAKEQEDALKRPEVVLRFQTARGELQIPTQFTLGDLVQKRIMDDLSAFVWLVVVEVNKISGSGINLDRATLLFHESVQPYFAVALRTSNVIEFLNTRLLLKIGQLFDAEGNRLNLNILDLNAIEDTVAPNGERVSASLAIGVNLIGRWAEAQAKNR